MGYDDMSASADKWLHADGSVTTLSGEQILPADAARAAEYARREPNAAKWLLPDGSVTASLPAAGNGDVGTDARFGDAPHDGKPYARRDGAWEAIAPYEPPDLDASAVAYDSAASGLGSGTAQGAIDELSLLASAAKSAAEGATGIAESAMSAAEDALSRIPKRAFVIADITAGDRYLTLGDCQVRLHRYGDYCQVYAKPLSSQTLYWSSTTNYDGAATQNRYGSGTGEQTVEDDIGYGGSANRMAANIQIGNSGWRLEVSETGTGAASANTRIWASLEQMEETT